MIESMQRPHSHRRLLLLTGVAVCLCLLGISQWSSGLDYGERQKLRTTLRSGDVSLALAMLEDSITLRHVWVVDAAFDVLLGGRGNEVAMRAVIVVLKHVRDHCARGVQVHYRTRWGSLGGDLQDVVPNW